MQTVWAAGGRQQKEGAGVHEGRQARDTGVMGNEGDMGEVLSRSLGCFDPAYKKQFPSTFKPLLAEPANPVSQP